MKVLVTLFLLLLLAAGAGYYFIATPFGPTSEVFHDIAHHTGTEAIAAGLEHDGIIRNRYAFLAWHLYRRGTLKAGEYRFDHPASVPEVYDRIARGDIYTKAVTIPEGYNLFDIAATLQNAGLVTSTDFLAAARSNTALIADLSPSAASLEGYLFPDTYRFSRHMTPAQMLAAMVRRFRQEATALNLTSEIPRTVIMASLVEKEVAVASERPLVAGVFENRLAQNMPLATDPTVVYAALLNNRWRGTIYQSDLAYDSPYNTYHHTGLPPGPIANPGRAALQAAIHPAQTDYLYFVADAAGHSVFSSNLAQHTQAVQSYRAAIRQQTPPAPVSAQAPVPVPQVSQPARKATHRRHR